jgi:tRNA 2-thiouridine synthesizing protein E
MNEIICDGNQIILDKNGFLLNPEDWNEEVALELSYIADNMFLSDEHWKLIHYVRKFYMSHGTTPMLKKMNNDTGYSLKRIYELFPQGPVKGLFRIAGMQKPLNCS